MIVNGYVDESEDETVFVMAGFVAPTEEWARFSEEWQSALDAPPVIKVLKTNDAMRSPKRGEWRGISDDARDEKLRLLYSVIEAHVGYSASAVVHMGPLKRISNHGNFPKQAANPYYHAISALISGVARVQIKQRISDEKVDWVFDERLMEQGKFLSVWDAIVHDAPQDVKPMIGGTPIFRKDDAVRPLQAGDLEAWWIRRRWNEKLRGLPRLEYPWHPEPIPECASVLDEEKLQEIFAKMQKMKNDLAILDPNRDYF